ncbi:MAG: RNA polymerase factor sigma-32 [Syntrophales bacterium]|nr:RNA polymerase factor sigma-32 [Syntrophales bacterium]MDD5641622.1 RNA polymerase factor sigma-32 [Syntrophales bacterium]
MKRQHDPDGTEEFSQELPEILEPEVEEADEETAEEGSEEAALPVPMEMDLLQRYIQEANRYSLLTPEEEKRLALLYRETQDLEAGSKLITSNLRLVIKIALEFQKFWMKNLLDLIQEGNIGLMHAIKKFDPYRGIKLSYYASFWIKAYILKFIMDNWKLVKIGTTQSQRKLFYNLRREKEKLRALGFEPGPKLLAENLNVREEEVIEMDQRLGGWELSLDAPLKEGSDEYHKNFLPATEPQVEEALAEAELKDLFRKKLEEFKKDLNEKELDILSLRLLAEHPLTLQEIGARHKISRERVRQIEDRMIKKLRHFLKGEIPDWEDYQTPMSD